MFGACLFGHGCQREHCVRRQHTQMGALPFWEREGARERERERERERDRETERQRDRDEGGGGRWRRGSINIKETEKETGKLFVIK